LATSQLHALLESTGKKAVVMGTSGAKDQVRFCVGNLQEGFLEGYR
jgi:hypothetical protein